MSKAFVAYCQDTDCDGVSHSFHYFEGEEGTKEEFLALQDGRYYDYIVFDVYTLTTFYCKMEVWGWPSEFSHEYFIKEGYFSEFVGNMTLLNSINY